MAEAIKKRKDLSLQEKQKILECYDKLPKMSQRSAAVHLKISQPLLCKILKNRPNIEKSVLANENIDRKRVRSGKDRQVESALKIWFGNIRDKNVSNINDALIRQKAEELAKEMGKENFTATEGWLTRWKKRENIVYKQMKKAEEKSAEICPATTEADSKLEEENEPNPEETSEAPPTNAQMREALKVLRRGVQHRSADFQKHYEYEQFINELLNTNTNNVQSTEDKLALNYYNYFFH